MGISWQFIITFVFWVFVAPVFITRVGLIWAVGLIFAHTYPFVLIIINFFNTDCTLRLRDWWHSALCGVVYCTLNYVVSVQVGQVYPFLDWSEPWLGAFYCFLCWLFGQVCYSILSLINEYKKGRPLRNAY